MTVEQLREYALGLPGVTEGIKWDDHLCFMVGEKMFLVTVPDHSSPSASFKVKAEDFEQIIGLPGFSKHVYLGRHNWVHLDNIGRISDKVWRDHISISYQLVASKLPLRTRKALGIE